MERLIDRFGREIYYLRISVTDRCNYRCIYCMPKEGIKWKPMEEILTYEEIAAFVEVAAALGIRKIKLTGGEPLVRRGLSNLVSMLKSIEGIEEISLTTNGSLLKLYAKELRDSGLDRVTVSIDTIDREKFKYITRFGSIDDVVEGVKELNRVGFKDSKINTVVMRHINDSEVVDLIRFSMELGFDIRFIELMPTDLIKNWKKHFMSIDEIKSLIEDEFRLEKADKRTNGPAVYYRVGGIHVGFITPLSSAFCSACNRIRLTSDGFILTCLGHSDRVGVRDAIRKGDREELARLIKLAVFNKPKEHALLSENIHSSMASVGG